MGRRRSTDVSSSKNRSAVSNRSRLHQKGDARSAGARRFRDLVDALSADLGDNLSEADLAMVRTAAGLTLKSELLQADLAAGKDVDAEVIIKLAGASRRALTAICVKAVERKPAGTMTLAEYAAQRAAEREALESDDEED
jgi:hypothetical protein